MNGTNNNAVNLHDFMDRLRQHEFCFTKAIMASDITPEGLVHLVNDIDEELCLYQIAWDYGDDYVKLLSTSMYRAKQQLIPSKTPEEIAEQALLEVLDEDLKAYSLRLKNHDWFWSFSDDASVARLASHNEEVLKKEAEAKEGYFLKLWSHYEALRSNSINKA